MTADGNRTYGLAQVVLLAPRNMIGKNTYMDESGDKPLDPRAVARGARMKAAREQLHMSQERVGEVLGVSRVTVSNYEGGKVGSEIEQYKRRGLCKLLGIEERQLLLDPESAPADFDMPISNEAKSIAYRWDDLPESFRVHEKNKIAEMERLIRENPDLAKRLFPELDSDSQNQKVET